MSDPKIVYSASAWRKMMAYIKAVDGEVSGLGRATEKDGVVYVSDVFIWKQKCSPTTTEVIDHDATFDLYYELEAQGIPGEELCVWWHSHNNFDVFFSGTDIATIKGWVNDKYLVAVCANKKSEATGCIAIKRPFPAMLEAVPVEYEIDPRETRADEIYTQALQQATAAHDRALAALGEDVSAEVSEKVTIERYDNTAGYKTDYTGGEYPGEILDREIGYANDCYCQSCRDLIDGKRSAFAYSEHYWDKTVGTYLSRSYMGDIDTEGEAVRLKKSEGKLTKREQKRLKRLTHA